jgi:hypothetical protein
MTGTQGNARREIVQTAMAMVAESLDLVSGSRRLCALRHEIGASDSELFDPIIGFESETDIYPVGNARAQYSQGYLQQLDQELAEYLDRSKPAVVAACKRIIESLG